MPQVQRIDPIVLPSEKESVAAYCRVSTDSADQFNSYHSQIAYYTQLINENPDWELYDIYADAGITGTSIDKRDEFKRMIVDCREGRIKRVLVKSVSRFARNTTELLETTRELKDLGVVVVFEEQGFDTSQVLGEMQLTMYAMAAQEESFSISNNMRWSYQKRMQNGSFMGTREVLARENIDLHKLMCVTDYSDVLCGEDIRKLADHLDDFIVIKGAETYADVGEYITQHEEGYEVGENMPDFVDYSKLGEFIKQEREGEFIGYCFVCMEDGCDAMEILHEKRNEIELGLV